MNRKGFISTALIYSFFLVFIAIILSIVLTYSSRRVLLSTIKKDIRQVMDNKQNNCFSKGITMLNECILENYGGVASINELDSSAFSDISKDINSGLFLTTDNDGDSYYFRGNVENNYVKFGKWSDLDSNSYAGSDMYWRIIRINGDGTIRLIYDGTEAVANATIHNSNINSSVFNTTYAYNMRGDVNAYVGYTYSGYYGTMMNSTIKNLLDSWYSKNLSSSSNISSSKFCNAQQIVNTTNGINYYETYDRLYTNKQPSLVCEEGIYELSIGLITADEIAFAGGVNEVSNNNYYLYSGESFWTLSPYTTGGSENTGYIWQVDANGKLTKINATSTNNIRPVINLKADTEIKSGNGTKSSPYIIKEVD